MATNALQKKMIDEFLEKIKDWPEDAKRSVVVVKVLISDQSSLN